MILRGVVDDAGGGIVTIIVDRNLAAYPKPGDSVVAVVGEVRLTDEERDAIDVD